MVETKMLGTTEIANHLSTWSSWKTTGDCYCKPRKMSTNRKQPQTQKMRALEDMSCINMTCLVHRKDKPDGTRAANFASGRRSPTETIKDITPLGLNNKGMVNEQLKWALH